MNRSALNDFDLQDEYKLFCDPKRLFMSDDVCFVFLFPGEKFGVWGNVNVEIMVGRVVLCGALLSENVSYLVNAPFSHSAAVLCCLHDSSVKEEQMKELFKNVPNYDRCYGCVIKISRNPEKVPSCCSSLYDEADEWLKVAKDGNDAIETFPLSWKQSLEELCAAKKSPPRILLCGVRGAGKSTFLRYCVNFLLSMHEDVYVVDTDPGQSELFCPGSVCLVKTGSVLFSPGYCSRKPFVDVVHAVLVPGVSPDRDVDHYCKSVASLKSHVPKNAPLLINTPGWITGLGLECLESSVSAFAPDAVFQMHDPLSMVSPLSFGSVPVYPLISPSSLNRVPSPMSASAMRDISLTLHIQCDACCLLELSMSELCFAFCDVESLSEELVIPSLYQCVVGLVCSSAWTKRKGTFSLSLPPDGKLLGFGIVREIRDDKKSLVVQCSERYVRSKNVNVIVRAEHELPLGLCDKRAGYQSQNLGGVGKQVMKGKKWIKRQKRVDTTE